jgi:AcrR family transcriptional regulator
VVQPTAPGERRTWAGIPADDRRADRRQRLLDAGFELLGTSGATATSVRAVCRQAGLNTRYFYESFDDVDALLVAVYDRTVGQLYRALAAADETAGEDPRARLRAGFETAVAFVDEDRRRGRVLFVEGRGNRAVDRHRVAAWQVLVEGIRGHDARTDDMRRRRDGDIGQVRAGMIAGGFTSLLVEWLDGRLDITRQQLVADATAASLQIVGLPPRSERDR